MTARAESARTSGDTVSPAHQSSQFQRVLYLVHQYAAAAFVAGVVFQVFVVGMALFVSGSHWNLHEWVGNLLNLLPGTMILTSLIGRMLWSTRLLSVALFLLVGMQHVTIAIGSWAAALHPVNALLLMGIGIVLYRRARESKPDALGR